MSLTLAIEIWLAFLGIINILALLVLGNSLSHRVSNLVFGAISWGLFLGLVLG